MTKVLCHGCFDVLHLGHIKHLEAAKKYGDYLIVSITDDRFINKGPGRPYFTAHQRAEMLRAIRGVDEVFISHDKTALSAIARFRPNFYVKGQDYSDALVDVTGEITNEKKAVEAYGGKVVFTNEETHSSSQIINKVFSPFSDGQKAKLEAIHGLGGYLACERAIEALAGLRVLVVGEPIIDIYRFCKPEGISSKSPTVSARFIQEEHYNGGSIAIANHLNDFCQVHAHWQPSANCPVKIRYISRDNNQRVFEVTHIDEDVWDHDFIAGTIPEHHADVVVAADFGHGLFEGPVLEALVDLDGFLGLNVQTNSSNFGFNVYTKHKRWDYLCIDRRELSLAHNDRHSDPMVLGSTVWDSFCKPLSVTLGPNGSALWTEKGLNRSPAFSDTVVDATGAGDAYFAITTLLIAAGCHPELTTFIGNVFAGLKTKIIGNKSSVSKAALLRSLKGILA